MPGVYWSMMYITGQKDFGYKIVDKVLPSRFSKSVQVGDDAHDQGTKEKSSRNYIHQLFRNEN